MVFHFNYRAYLASSGVCVCVRTCVMLIINTEFSKDGKINDQSLFQALSWHFLERTDNVKESQSSLLCSQNLNQTPLT
jgi:hypothetical protein